MEIIRIEGDPVPAARRAAEILEKGGIVIYPTDTLYGFAVDALNRRAIAKLKLLKRRMPKWPMSIIVRNHKDLNVHGKMSADAEALAERHLPGALTLVVPAETHIPEDLTLNGTIGLRIPQDSFVEALSFRFPRPFTATSANRSGQPPCGSVADIITQFGTDIIDIDLVVDDGPRSGNTPSTVVTFQDGKLRILREGAISREELGF